MPSTPFYQALLAGAVFCVVLAVVGGVLTKLTSWYHNLRKPGWKPPDWAFGPVWTTIFICLTIAIAYAWDAGEPAQRSRMLVALAINGVLNMAWSAIFFTFRRPGLALAELVVFWISIVWLMVVLGGSSGVALALLVPYLAWVTAAGLLNYQIVRLNP